MGDVFDPTKMFIDTGVWLTGLIVGFIAGWFFRGKIGGKDK